MRQKRFSGASLVLLMVAATGFSSPAHGATKSTLSESVSVSGVVEKPFTITRETLRGMKVEERGNAAIVCESGQTKQTLKTFKGVLLRDILDSAKVAIANPRQRGEYGVLVRSIDDYNVLFSYNELYYGLTGENTLMVFEENGKPIQKDGQFVLFCTNDRVTGPRLVKMVSSIEVFKVNPSKP